MGARTEIKSAIIKYRGGNVAAPLNYQLIMDKLSIVKRDGSVVPFSADKIVKSMSAAFKSVGRELSMETVSEIMSKLHLYDGIPF